MGARALNLLRGGPEAELVGQEVAGLCCQHRNRDG
jgi:hypothetical protein